jgi:hypothetical protein
LDIKTIQELPDIQAFEVGQAHRAATARNNLSRIVGRDIPAKKNRNIFDRMGLTASIALDELLPLALPIEMNLTTLGLLELNRKTTNQVFEANLWLAAHLDAFAPKSGDQLFRRISFRTTEEVFFERRIGIIQ